MDMEKQKEPNWCWAAVAASIHNFLSSSGTLTQAEIATHVLQDEKQIQPDVDCSKTPDLCNWPAALDDALSFSGNLYLCRRNGHLAFDNLKAWVDANFPIGARIVWAVGGAHFVVVDGYRELQSGAKQVHVQDPDGDPTFQFYEDFVRDYPPGGTWQDTYLVKKEDGPESAARKE